MIVYDLLPYVCAILALLLVWQYHRIQVLTGRVRAFDIFERSSARMYVYATPNDDEICESCREINGRTFLPSSVTRRDFNPRGGPCLNKGRCTIVMVGLYAAWPEARRVVQQLRAVKEPDSLRLSFEELVELTQGSWQTSVSASTDRLAVAILVALTAEKLDPIAALAGYREVINDAQEIHDLPLVVPAYLRLTELLIRQGRTEEALGVIEDFERRYPQAKTGPYYPSGRQRGMMAITKSHLRANLHLSTTSSKQEPRSEAGFVVS